MTLTLTLLPVQDYIFGSPAVYDMNSHIRD